MTRKFYLGQHLKAIADLHPVNEYGQHTGNIILASSNPKFIVVSYRDKTTEELEDDLVKLKIINIDDGYDDDVGNEFWIASSDFVSNLKPYL